jgi:hypothetical protein
MRMLGLPLSGGSRIGEDQPRYCGNHLHLSGDRLPGDASSLPDQSVHLIFKGGISKHHLVFPAEKWRQDLARKEYF